ncbi:MAG: hypothetical protein ACTTH8_01825 [Treponema sp.]
MQVKRFVLLYLLISAALLYGEPLAGDKAAAGQSADAKKQTGEEAVQESAFAPLPSEYRGIQLGMPIDTVKDLLKKDSIFGYRGERDVSLLLTENRSLIETSGSLFINRSWFQFYDSNLYTMIFKLNTDAVDYYSVYSKFCRKYGEPVFINPQRAIWEDEKIRVVIERPLIVKYIDLTVFNELLSKTAKAETYSETRRNDFIDSF